MEHELDQPVIEKIRELYADDSERQLVILVHLSQQDEASRRSLRQLRRCIRNGDNESFRDICDTIYDNNAVPLNHARGNSLLTAPRSDGAIDIAINSVEFWLSQTPLIIGLGGPWGVPLVLGATVGFAVWRWMNGQITGEEAAERIVRSTANSIGAGAGFVGGAAIGSVAGPIGGALGGSIGAVVGFFAADTVFRQLRNQIFSGTGDEAVNRAYRYFNLRPDSTDHEVIAAYQQQTLRTHPNRPGGSVEQQRISDTYMAAIRVHRGDSSFRPN